MKIMYCITNASWGGAQLHVLELCRDQIRRGNEVVFIVGSEGVLLDRVKEIEGVKAILLPSLVREVNVIKDLQAIRDLRNLILKEKPDILHLHSSKAGTVGRIAAINLPVCTVFTVHGWAFTNGAGSNVKRNLYKIVEKAVSPLTNLFICVSEYDYKIGVSNHVLNERKNNAVTIHNGVEIPKQNNVEKEIPKQNDIEKEFKTIVMTARFSKQKDQLSLIKALGMLNNKNYKMVFVGDGDTLKECQELVSKLNLSDKVSFVGFKSDVTLYLKQSDIYVLSTHYEGLPISIIEAMSYGLPIITTNVGGNSELIDKNGILIDAKDAVKQLASAIDLLISDTNLIKNMGTNSYYKFEKEFLLGKQLQTINDEYLNLIMTKK